MTQGVTKDDVYIKPKGNEIRAYVRCGGVLYSQGVQMHELSRFYTRKMVADLVYDVNRIHVYGPHKLEDVCYDPAIDGQNAGKR